jgi:hypothetical protein
MLIIKVGIAGGARAGEVVRQGAGGSERQAGEGRAEKENWGLDCHRQGWSFLWRNPRDVSSVAVAKMGFGLARAVVEVPIRGWRLHLLA